jgi:hypothetical protein
MTNNHNHNRIKGVMTPPIRAELDEFINSELRKIESRLSEISMKMVDNSRDIPEDWSDCEDCEEKMLDAYDDAFGFAAKEFYKAIENHL